MFGESLWCPQMVRAARDSMLWAGCVAFPVGALASRVSSRNPPSEPDRFPCRDHDVALASLASAAVAELGAPAGQGWSRRCSGNRGGPGQDRGDDLIAGVSKAAMVAARWQ